mgnify:CR=1 FL=1|tara:strand:- start:1843 stop:3663 length:1821 start_codon:yes stop_codon:yes gene_type:complete
MIKNIDYQVREINKRSRFLVLISLLLFFIVGFNVFKIQVLSSKKYQEIAMNNIKKEEYIVPERGEIYDRDGKKLVSNEIIYKPEILLEEIKGYGGSYNSRKKSLEVFFKQIEDRVGKLSTEINYDDILKKPSFLKIDIFNREDYKKINSLAYIDGLTISPYIERVYNYGDDLFFPIGYASKVSKSDLIEYKDINLRMNNIIGKSGLEKYFNESLHGANGIKEKRLSASGRVVDSFVKKQPMRGKDIKLSIDADLQKKILSLVDGEKGAISVMNVNTGEILAYASFPSVDPNMFVRGMSSKEYNEIVKSDNKLMLDRVADGVYPPASTIKQYMAYAVLLGEYFKVDETMKTSGTYRVGDSVFRDWIRWGHGEVDLKRSLSRSVDYFYYKFGHEMGIDFIHDVLSMFGYGKSPKIKEKETSSGILPSNKWKIKNYGERFYAGEVITISIGQGQFLATPLQMMHSLSVLINGGKSVEMTFQKRDKSIFYDEYEMNDEYLNVIKQGLYDVVNTKDGTGRAVRDFTDVVVAGKTGTAQVFSTKGEVDYENEEIEKELRDHAYFVAFAPFENPEIAISVVIENGGGGGTVAAPIAGKIIDYYFNGESYVEKN